MPVGPRLTLAARDLLAVHVTADLNADDFLDFLDLIAFDDAFEAGC